MLVNGTIRAMLCLEDPLAANQIDTRWPGHKTPCMILAKGDKFIGHGSVPGRLPESIAIRDGSGVRAASVETQT
jgi:hypothetical protein